SEPPLSTEKASIVGQVRQFTKCATSGKMRNISQKRQCRASGFVLEPIVTDAVVGMNVSLRSDNQGVDGRSNTLQTSNVYLLNQSLENLNFC
ncbi:hypothetical protein, partial [Yoonia sp. R2-816]|uniref:hypothetical protein n=1 Tax=Yoonia sp. R2-816 TaxID=3342638 RepID=UPI00372C0FB4